MSKYRGPRHLEVDGDKVQCPICGCWRKALAPVHLKHKHKLTPDQFREQYNVPWTEPLCGDATRVKTASAAKRAIALHPQTKIVPGHRGKNRPGLPSSIELRRENGRRGAKITNRIRWHVR